MQNSAKVLKLFDMDSASVSRHFFQTRKIVAIFVMYEFTWHTYIEELC